MDDREIFLATLRMYELAEGQPRVAILPATEDVSLLVDRLFDEATGPLP